MNWNNHVYINLYKRKDRNIQTVKELKKIGIDEPNRFDAVEDDIGIIGCCKSHIQCIRTAMEQDLPYLLVFEDDIQIVNARLLKIKVNNLINTDFDVLMLGGNNFGGCKINNNLIKVEKCFTTTAYIIKKHYYQTWLNNLEEGLKLLEKTNDRKYSLDFFNHKLQVKDSWYLVIPPCIIQRSGYSDIENKHTDYRELMMNVGKS